MKQKKIKQRPTPPTKNDPPEIFAIRKVGDGHQITRRDFVGRVGAIGTGLGISTLAHGTLPAKGEYTLIAHLNTVTDVSFSDDNQYLVSCSEDATIKIWDLSTKKVVKTIKKLAKPIKAVEIQPGGKLLASTYLNNAKLWKHPTGRFVKSLFGHTGKVNSLHFSGNGNLLATGSSDTTVKIWDVSKKQLLHTLERHADVINMVKFSPDDKLLVSASDDDTIVVWNADNGSKLKSWESGLGGVRCVCFSPDGKTIASTGAKNNRIKFWEVSSGDEVGQIQTGDHYDDITSMEISPDGKKVAIAVGRYISILSVPSGESLLRIEGHTDDIRSVSFSPDGKLLATCGEDKTIRVWTMPGGESGITLFDPDVTEKIGAMEVQKLEPVIQILPCGTPIPPGSSCICDCIASSRTYPGSETICTCNTVVVPANTPLAGNMVCVCNTIIVGSYVAPAPSASSKSKSSSGSSSGSRKTYSGGRSSSYSYTYWYPN